MDKRWDLYDAKKLYKDVKETAEFYGLEQSLVALPLMKELHDGQFRKGSDHKPYIVHPLMIAKHAISLGLIDDALIAAILLHDTVEDCGVTKDELPVSDEVREIVQLVSYFKQPDKSKAEAKREYFDGISRSPKASVVKILDRCNNISTMAESFTPDRIAKYIEETENYILPLIENVIEAGGEYGKVAFVAEYQIASVIRSLS